MPRSGNHPCKGSSPQKWVIPCLERDVIIFTRVGPKKWAIPCQELDIRIILNHQKACQQEKTQLIILRQICQAPNLQRKKCKSIIYLQFCTSLIANFRQITSMNHPPNSQLYEKRLIFPLIFYSDVQYLYQGSKTLASFLAFVHLIPSWLLWAEIKCMVQSRQV